MTVFTPLRGRLSVLWVRAVFLWVRASATGTPSIQELSFIHFARWGIIRRVPDFGQPKERLRQPLFMFESNYNGSFEAYIDAFAQILGAGMAQFWGSSYGFPGPLPVKPFKTYIRANEFVVGHYYSAYPAAAATMVVRAVAAAPRLEGLVSSAPSLTPEAFSAAYAKLFDVDRPGQQKPTALAVAANVFNNVKNAVRARQPGHGSDSGESYYFTSLVPILQGHEAELADAISALSAGPSPFGELPHVHFARLMIVDRLRMGWAGAPRRPAHLRSQYLLFTAAVSALAGEDPAASPGPFLESLDATLPGVAHNIWRHCWGYAGTPTDPNLAAYLPKSQLDTLLFYVGCRDTTPARVAESLSLHRRLVAFARSHQGVEDDVLRDAFIEESATWP